MASRLIALGQTESSRRDRISQASSLIPVISPRLVRLFSLYLHHYLGRSFHAVRLYRPLAAPPADLESSGGRDRLDTLGRPLVIYLNHPSWWDPLICLFLAYRLFPNRLHYGPIDAEALERYRIFKRLGFFGVTPGRAGGGAAFLRVSQAILQQSHAVLWITPEGQFSDPRQRPTALQPGLGYLARRLGQGTVLPLALEYPFWQERFPEALVHFGEPLRLETMSRMRPEAYTKRFQDRLEATQDTLALGARGQNPAQFETLLSGRAGIGGIYDAWRAASARLRGERFRKAHGEEAE